MNRYIWGEKFKIHVFIQFQGNGVIFYLGCNLLFGPLSEGTITKYGHKRCCGYVFNQVNVWIKQCIYFCIRVNKRFSP